MSKDIKKQKLNSSVNLNFPIPKEKSLDDLPVNSRTKIATGKSVFLDTVDGRSILSRRFKELYLGVLEDLGGIDYCTDAQKQIVKRAATLSVIAEGMECDLLAQTDEFNLSEYIEVTKTLNATFKVLGTKREMRELNPEQQLDSYLNKNSSKSTRVQ